MSGRAVDAASSGAEYHGLVLRGALAVRAARGAAVITITHDVDELGHAGAIVRLVDGRLATPSPGSLDA
ncbi:ABC-type iron transport system FetAB ATPase subunit [Microbacterium marinum]|uniref:ABC-type iron transport system FetAB ATPase subunit n=1 Tax=Microbacterium marinum TaxID=421115 RepID=A0A7W7FJ83_9MICO|nr:hypothetical protein [Microbacterium marinum]MBB4668166.1 ABC-type iron transport system FetAB ATPase subunit [Microbacterium marinum]